MKKKDKKKKEKGNKVDKDNPAKGELGQTALDIFYQMRTKISKITYRSLRQYAKKMGWLKDPFTINILLNGDLEPLTNRDFFKLCKQYTWLNQILDLAEDNDGHLTYGELKHAARKSSYSKKQPNRQVLMVKQAFLLYLWIWTAEQQTNLNLVIADGNYYPPGVNKYMPIEVGHPMYLRCNDVDLKEKVKNEYLLQYLSLVKNVATRMAMGYPRSVELSDLIGCGVVGLIQALGSFDATRGFKFRTYAEPRIRGAILDDLRAMDWVPRSDRAKRRTYEEALIVLTNELGGKIPTFQQIAERMGISYDALMLHMFEHQKSRLRSLDKAIYPEDDNREVSLVETVPDQDQSDIVSVIAKQQVISFIVDHINNNLSNQESWVIKMYYWDEHTLKVIGEYMSISESRVSQIHTRALIKLRQACKIQFGDLYQQDILDWTLKSVRVVLPDLFLPDYFAKGVEVPQYSYAH